MSYVLNKTNGEILTNLLDGTTNTETGLTLIGKNYPTYGEFQNENFIRLLENFADNIPPGQSVGINPIAGQLWWDTGNVRLRVYDGNTGEFLPVSEQTVSNTAPAVAKLGDQWFNTLSKQLFVNSGSGWQLIGPAYPNSLGISGEVVSNIADDQNNQHTIVAHYTNNNIYSIDSNDPLFTPLTHIQGFTNIAPGLNLRSGTILNGTADNSNKLNNLYSNSYARVDQDSIFSGNIGINGALVVSYGNVYYANGALTLKNSAYNGNVNVFVTSSTLGVVNALTVDGATGLVKVNGDPVAATGVATKNYIDNSISGINYTIATQIAEVNGNVTALYNDYLANVNLINQTYPIAINNLGITLSASIAALSSSTDNRFTLANANAAAQSATLNNHQAQINLRANIADPAFTGNPTVPTVAPNNNSDTIASTAYVDASALVLFNDYNSKFTSAALTTANNLSVGLAPKANIASPVFTGVPQSVTPAPGDNSTMISTTAFVQKAITDSKFNYNIATTAPGDATGLIFSTNGAAGNNGDFWFQIG